jgi:hypothetical protein
MQLSPTLPKTNEETADSIEQAKLTSLHPIFTCDASLVQIRILTCYLQYTLFRLLFRGAHRVAAFVHTDKVRGNALFLLARALRVRHQIDQDHYKMQRSRITGATRLFGAPTRAALGARTFAASTQAKGTRNADCLQINCAEIQTNGTVWWARCTCLTTCLQSFPRR